MVTVWVDLTFNDMFVLASMALIVLPTKSVWVLASKFLVIVLLSIGVDP